MEGSTNSTELKEHYDHKLYKHCGEKEAEAVAWAFVNGKKFVEFPYKNIEVAADEIRASVLYTGLCLSDSMHCRGRWGETCYPSAPGHEIIAEVLEVGSDVKDFKVGEKVAFGTLRKICGVCRFCKQGRESICEGELHKFTYGPLYWGGYSTQVQQPADFFFHIPEKLDLKKAAPLLCAGITVYTPIKKYAKPGDRCAVIGIGGLGHLAVMFLSKMGYEVTAVTSSMNKKDFILGLGATEVVDEKDASALVDKEFSFDFIISTTPSVDNFPALFNLTAPGGSFVLVGSGDGTNNLSVSVPRLVVSEAKLIGSCVGTREDIKEMLQLCADKDIYPICEFYSFQDFPEALEKLENGRPIFRCVVEVGDYSKDKGLRK